MKSPYYYLKSKVVTLRQTGKSYGEIRKALNKPIPKSTLSNWCNSVVLPQEYREKIKELILNNSRKGRIIALAVNKVKRQKYLDSVAERNKHLANLLENRDIAKIAIAMLYLGEGSKTRKGSLMFGNSDPLIVGLFLHLLRHCYSIDERKFRCTVQCRADQDTRKLEVFWHSVTKIPTSQFYRAQIDPRTVGKPSKKPDYKGVCRIDYFSADISIELEQIVRIIYKGP